MERREQRRQQMMRERIRHLPVHMLVMLPRIRLVAPESKQYFYILSFPPQTLQTSKRHRKDNLVWQVKASSSLPSTLPPSEDKSDSIPRAVATEPLSEPVVTLDSPRSKPSSQIWSEASQPLNPPPNGESNPSVHKPSSHRPPREFPDHPSARHPSRDQSPSHAETAPSPNRLPAMPPSHTYPPSSQSFSVSRPSDIPRYQHESHYAYVHGEREREEQYRDPQSPSPSSGYHFPFPSSIFVDTAAYDPRIVPKEAMGSKHLSPIGSRSGYPSHVSSDVSPLRPQMSSVQGHHPVGIDPSDRDEAHSLSPARSSQSHLSSTPLVHPHTQQVHPAHARSPKQGDHPSPPRMVTSYPYYASPPPGYGLPPQYHMGGGSPGYYYSSYYVVPLFLHYTLPPGLS